MTEGEKKSCTSCKTEIIHVKITKSFQGKTEEKLQWQNIDDRKPHFKWISDGKYDCIKPTEQSIIQAHADEKEEVEVQCPNTIKVKDPFHEAELIVAWARDKAYKMVMREVTDVNTLTQQQKNSLGQKEGMLTRALVDTTIELMKIHGVKTDYGN